MSDMWTEQRFTVWWYDYCRKLGLATSENIMRLAYDAYKAGYAQHEADKPASAAHDAMQGGQKR